MKTNEMNTVGELSDMSGLRGLKGLFARNGSEMVAIGDSTMALAPTPARPTSDNGCIHSSHNWPELVSRVLGLQLADLSCAGARIDYYWKQPLHHLGDTTKLVVFSLGSNDFGTVDQLFRAVGKPGEQPLHQRTSQADVEECLGRVLADIRRRAPHANIVVVGYLPLVNAPCPHILPHMTAREQRLIARMRSNSDKALENAAAAAGEGVYFLSLRHVRGRDLSCPDTSFIINKGRGVRFHYTVEGVRFIAKEVIRAYRRHLS